MRSLYPDLPGDELQEPKPTVFGRVIDRFASKHVASIFTGESTTGWYSRRVTELLMKHTIGGEDLAPLRIA